jgi:hypothetical protein
MNQLAFDESNRSDPKIRFNGHGCAFAFETQHLQHSRHAETVKDAFGLFRARPRQCHTRALISRSST